MACGRPAESENSETVVMFSPCSSTGVRKQSASGPAIATRAWSTRRTHGTIWPKSKRITSSERIGTIPSTPLDDPHDVRGLAARRHEVDRADDALGGLVGRLEHERVAPVCARARVSARRGREHPAAVVGRPEQRREARARVEAREAAPVDRPLAVDQRGGLQVADQGVVLDPRHPRIVWKTGGRAVSDFSRTPALPRRLRLRQRPRRRRGRTSRRGGRARSPTRRAA